MNIFVNENPILVAPRPIRIGAVPYQHFGRSNQLRLVGASVDNVDRIRLAEDTSDAGDVQKNTVIIDGTPIWDRDLSSSRQSPRSNLQSEVLEEFLSILRPAIFPPSSPVSRVRRNGVTSLPSFGNALGRIDISHGKGDAIDPIEEISSPSPMRSPEPSNEQEGGSDELDSLNFEFLPTRWYAANTLASPISRYHTRNPFQRQAAYEVALSGRLSASRSSPSVITQSPISPATVPLPLPTPDEMTEVY